MTYRKVFCKYKSDTTRTATGRSNKNFLIMKKNSSMLFIGILISILFSCTPEQVVDNTTAPQACCDETGEIDPPLPPPPPPPIPGNGTGS
jgi:hypothetical protein